MLKVALLLIAVAEAITCASARNLATANVVIRAIDQSGAVISNVRVRVIPPPDPLPAKMETGGNGELPLQLQPGGHAVIASASGFKVTTLHIEVQAPSSPAQIIPVMLKVADTFSPVVLSEEQAAQQASELFLSAMPYHVDWWITKAEFKAMPRVSIVVHSSDTNRDESYTGVRFSDLLMLAGAPLGKELYGVALRTYVAADDVVFSLAELDPGLHSGEILIADSMNGHALNPPAGPFLLVVSADRRRTRWVRHLQSITLHP